MIDPRATNEDLTPKARIRNAALDLFAEHGTERVSMRAIAAEAGVTLGLVQHHFKTKAGLRDAVDQLVVDYFTMALRDVADSDDPAAHAAARDEAVRRMLAANPPVVNYIRRALLEPSDERMHLLTVLIDLTRRELDALRAGGLVSQQRPESVQIVSVLIRQMGELFLRPMVEAVWGQVAEPADGPRPGLAISVVD